MKATNAQRCCAEIARGPRTDAEELRKLPEGEAGALTRWAAGQLCRGVLERGREAQAGSKGRWSEGGDAFSRATEGTAFQPACLQW